MARGWLGIELVLLLLTGFVFDANLTSVEARWSRVAFAGSIIIGAVYSVVACSLTRYCLVVLGTNLCSEDSNIVFIGTREYTHFLNGNVKPR